VDAHYARRRDPNATMIRLFSGEGLELASLTKEAAELDPFVEHEEIETQEL
jgi:hypothetical protein